MRMSKKCGIVRHASFIEERLLRMKNHLFSLDSTLHLTALKPSTVPVFASPIFVQSMRYVFAIFGKHVLLLLSYHFTKKRSSKICKIEKINRQMPNKNGLIFTK